MRARLTLLLCWICCAASFASAEEQIYFSRNFPGSSPPYFDVLLTDDGAAAYREAEDEEPLTFKLSSAEVERLFSLARELRDFGDELVSRRKVAFTGDKVLRFERDGEAAGEVKFNYTENAALTELVNFFLRVAETERHLIELERVVQFDRLGVNKALLQLQSSFDRGRVVAPEQFLPILSKINEQSKIIHLARARAASLIERIELPAGID